MYRVQYQGTVVSEQLTDSKAGKRRARRPQSSFTVSQTPDRPVPPFHSQHDVVRQTCILQYPEAFVNSLPLTRTRSSSFVRLPPIAPPSRCSERRAGQLTARTSFPKAGGKASTAIGALLDSSVPVPGRLSDTPVEQPLASRSLYDSGY